MKQLAISVLVIMILGPTALWAVADDPHQVAEDPLRIVYNTGVAPLKFIDDSGEPAGLFPDIWRLWAQKAGRTIQFIQKDSFDESLDLVRSGAADLHAGVFKTEEREQFLAYSEPLLELKYYIFTHPAIQPIHTLDDASGLIVGIQKGGFTENWVRARVPNERIAVYDSFTNLFRAAQRGDVKVFVATEISLLYYLSRYRLANIFAFEREHPLYSQVYYTATATKNKTLIKAVNAGLAAISRAERAQLEQQWIVRETRTIPANFAALLTEEEHAFLSETLSITAHNEIDWAPFNFNQNGVPMGFSIDYMSLLAEKIGLDVQFVNYPSWDEFLVMIQAGELDVMLNIVQTPEREKYLVFTPPYIEQQMTLYTRKYAPAIHSITDLFGKRIAVPEGFYIQELLKPYPEIELLLVEDVTETIQAVSSGKADAMFGLSPVVGYIANQLQITNLKANDDASLFETEPFADQTISLHIAVHQNQPILASILEKGMSQITAEELRLMQQRWFDSAGMSPSALSLTPEERKWLKAHPVIRVSNELDYAPFDFFEDGQPAGFSIDYLRLLAERIGVQMEFVQDTWDNLLKGGQQKQIDLLHTLYQTADRMPYFLYTPPYKSVTHMLYVHEDMEDIRSVSDLSRKRVIVLTGGVLPRALVKSLPGIELLYYDTLEESIKALSMGKGDATVMDSAVANYLLRKYTLTNIQAVAEVDISEGVLTSAYRLAVRNDWPVLHDILQKAMNTVTDAEMDRLYLKWFGSPEIAYRKTLEIPLAPEEQAFVASHAPLVFSEVNWQPLSFADDQQQYDGMIADYLRVITERSGLQFVFQPTESDTWAEVLQKYVNRDINVVPALGKDDNIGREILLSQPFATFPLVIVTSDDVSYIRETAELNGKRVAVGRGYTSYHFLHNNYPGIELVETDDVKAALLKLSNGDVFAFVGHLAVTIDHLQRLGLKNLKIAGETEFLFDHRIGVDPQYPEALSIINKVLASMTTQDHNAIYRKWLEVEYETRVVDYSLVWKILAVAMVVVAGISLWNWKLSTLNSQLNIEIAERQKSEEALRHANETALRAKNAALEAQQRALEAKEAAEAAQRVSEAAQKASEAANRAKSEFLANMSHELRTPLNAILGYTQLLTRDKKLAPKHRESITTIHRSGEHLLELINDILDLSKIEAGKLELQSETFSLEQSLKTIVEMFRMRATQKGLDFEYNFAEDLPRFVIGDPKRLRQILLNLLSNAIKFTEQGRVTLLVKKIGALESWSTEKNTDLQHSNTPAPQYSDTPILIYFEVKDTGIGIPPDRVEEIFKPFHQVGEQRFHIEGSGLGLAICRRIVRAMGSELHVDSTPGAGSHFWFEATMPVIKEHTDTPAEQVPAIVDFTGKNRKILIVDDNDDNRIVLANWMHSFDFEVADAANGHDALTLAKTFQPDLIFMDLFMPELDGFAVTHQIKHTPELRHIPVIAFSAGVSDHIRQQSREAGCDDFLAKPFRGTDLVPLLERYLDGHFQYTVKPEPHIGREHIPEAVRAAFHEAVSALDVKGVEDAIRELRRYNSALAETSAAMLKAYRFDSLETLLKQPHTPPVPAVTEAQISEALAALPDHIVHALQQAAIQGNSDVVESLLQDIRQHHAASADVSAAADRSAAADIIAALATEFEWGKILSLLQAAKSQSDERPAEA